MCVVSHIFRARDQAFEKELRVPGVLWGEPRRRKKAI
jgi:hypothetical protein